MLCMCLTHDSLIRPHEAKPLLFLTSLLQVARLGSGGLSNLPVVTVIMLQSQNMNLGLLDIKDMFLFLILKTCH